MSNQQQIGHELLLGRMKEHDYAAYVGDLVILLREAADGAKRLERSESDKAGFMLAA